MTQSIRHLLALLLGGMIVTSCAESTQNSETPKDPARTDTRENPNQNNPAQAGTEPDQGNTNQTPKQDETQNPPEEQKNPDEGNENKPDNPDNPDNPDKPDKPDNPNKPDNPGKTDSHDGDPIEQTIDGYMVLPITYAPYTTLQRAHRPIIGTRLYDENYVKSLIAANEFRVNDTDSYDKYGMGFEAVEGEPWILRDDLVPANAPKLSHKGKSLAWFWQISDPQILDQESPCRMEGVTIAPYVTASAYRAQGKYSTHMFDLHLQTAMRISSMGSRPFDFALVTGDVADNAQKNEHDWFSMLMGGGVLDPDTGIDDDPFPGPNNDFADPYYTQGIGNIPWFNAIGNHDLLYMGFAPITEKTNAACVGDTVVDLFDFIPILASHEFRNGYQNGFQDASKPDSPVVTTGNTPADPRRRQVSKAEALEDFYDAPGLPKGHGMDRDIMAKGFGYYSTYPMPGKPIRLITLDLNRDDWSEAGLQHEQFEWLGEQLEEAKDKNELVLVQSHHGTNAMGGSAVTAEALIAKLASYPNVLMHITGHGHYNDLKLNKTKDGGYWELMLASVIEFPSQTRIFEIVYEGDGYITIYVTNLDANAPAGTMVDEALKYAAARKYFSKSKDGRKAWDEERDARNLILRTRVPEEIYKNIEKYEWSDVIESETVLNQIQYNP